MRPGRPLFIALLTILFISAASYFEPRCSAILFGAVLALLLVAAADAFILFFFTAELTVERRMDANCAAGHPCRIELSFSRSGRGFENGALTIFDLYDDLFDCDAFPVTLTAPSQDEKTVFSYEALPVERGNWLFPACEVLFSSPLHFWKRKKRYATVSSGRVYPDFSMITSQSDIWALLEKSGEKKVRRRGSGLEFERLRDWQPGDSVRTIDWRATSRRSKVIIREYIEEQDQQVLFLLDSGFRLHRQEEASIRRTQFDAALDAALLLSWTALKHGDAVSGAVFGAEDRWLPPRRGLSALSRLLNAFYDVQSAPVPSSIFAALENALNNLKRRTFIVLISNFREEDAEQLALILPSVRKRHLLLLANIRESEIDALAARRFPPGSLPPSEDILVAASAASYCMEHKKLMADWERQGFLTLESSAGALSSSLINRYLKLKRSGAL